MNREKDLMRLAEEMKDLPSKVDPSLWTNISSQIGGAGAASSAGAAASSKGALLSVGQWVAVAVGAAGITTAALVYTSPNDSETVQSSSSSVVVNEKENIQKEDVLTAYLNTEDQLIEEPSSKLNDEMPVEVIVGEVNTEVAIDSKLPSEVSTVEDKPVTVPSETQTTSPIGSDTESEIKETEIPEKTEEKFSPLVSSSDPKINIKELPKEDIKPQKPEVEEPVEEKPKKPVFTDEGIDDFPNTFTPNGDRINDYFEVKSHGLTDYSMFIKDRTGKTVFSTNDPNAKWDGTIYGEPLPVGSVYTVVISAKNSNGDIVSKVKLVTIN